MLSPGTLLQQRYAIVNKIGQGGMGAIYEATDQRLGHRVAIKQTLVNDLQFARAFEREARLLAGLRHPSLPKVSDHWQDEQGQFLVMEYIPGDDLAALVQKRNQLLPVDTVLRWSYQLLVVLRYLHTQQPPIVHRDIKPHNIKITPQDELILLDFGLAKGMVDATVQTAASMYAYTLQYAPLEQIHGQPTDQRSDLYSFAATIYFLLNGVPPPSAVARSGALAIGQPDPLRPLTEIRPDVPTHVDAAVRQGLSLFIGHRPVSAMTFHQALAEPAAPTVVDLTMPNILTNDAPQIAGPPATAKQTTFVAVQVSHQPKVRFLSVLILGVVATVAVLGALWGFLVMQSHSEPLALAPTDNTVAIESIAPNTPQPIDSTMEPTSQTAAAAAIIIAPTEATQSVITEETTAEPLTSAPTEIPVPDITGFTVGQTAYVQMAKELPLWSEASGGTQIFERPLLTRGAMLAVVGVQVNAVQVRTVDGVDGWLHGAPIDVITSEAPIYAEQDNYAVGTNVVFVWPNGIPLRNAPYFEADKVIEKIASGTAATVTQQLGDWVEVTLDNKKPGWVRWFYDGKRYVVPKAPQFNRILDEAKPKMSGDDVLLVQRQLLVLGYNQPDNLDGIYGPQTIEQVRAFQQRNNLDVDGVVGKQTWQRLFDGSANANQP